MRLHLNCAGIAALKQAEGEITAGQALALYSLAEYPFDETTMHLDKAKKRLSKQLTKGFEGYPSVSLAYFGETADKATEVVVTFVLEEGAAAQEQKFSATEDVRQDEAIQSVLVKIIERSGAKTVTEVPGVSLK
jgi:hypothetical protein